MMRKINVFPTNEFILTASYSLDNSYELRGFKLQEKLRSTIRHQLTGHYSITNYCTRPKIKNCDQDAGIIPEYLESLRIPRIPTDTYILI